MILSDATMSPCGLFRYDLIRHWCMYNPRRMVFIGLNPSTANAAEDDPTIRRCVGFAKREGFGGIVMLNLFAFRAKLPRDMMHAPNPVGPENDNFIKKYSTDPYCQIIAAWGRHGAYKGRDQEVAKMIPCLFCFGITKNGNPRHPLYLMRDSPLMEYIPEAVVSDRKFDQAVEATAIEMAPDL